MPPQKLHSHNISQSPEWVKSCFLNESEIELIREKIEAFSYKPLFSIILPVYNVDKVWLCKCIDSVLAQIYPKWELCIADDASTDDRIKTTLEEYMAKDSRVKVVFRESNGHISACSNSALELATGDFIALLDNDDELTPDALYENALLLNTHPEADMIYSDECKIDERGVLSDPAFKPDWSPDYFFSAMYTCHLGVYRRTVIEEIGGFRVGYEGSQDYDLVLRLTERTDKIFHIPKILYHWRMIPGSSAYAVTEKSYAYTAGLNALQDSLKRRNERGTMEHVKGHPGHYIARYQVQGSPLISIIIHSVKNAETLCECLSSLYSHTNYSNFEVIILDETQGDERLIGITDKYNIHTKNPITVINTEHVNNRAKSLNTGSNCANGEILAFLSCNTKITQENWLEEMGGQAQRKKIGAVSSTIIAPNMSIHHAGIILGMTGIVGYAHRGADINFPGYMGRLLSIINYTAVTADCLMVEKVIFCELGGFDENLDLEYYDVDFCLKLISHGYNNVCLPHVRLYQIEPEISEIKPKGKGNSSLSEKNAHTIKKRWATIINNDPCHNRNLNKEKNDFSAK